MPDITTNALPLAPSPAADKIENRKSQIENPKLLKAAREFESYFVGVVLKKMHDSAAKGGLFGDDKSETQTYREMFDDAVAQQIGKRGSFGIADMLYRELGGTRGSATEPAAAAPAGQAVQTMQASAAAAKRASMEAGKDHEHE